jgi:hypothetical protein
VGISQSVSRSRKLVRVSIESNGISRDLSSFPACGIEGLSCRRSGHGDYHTHGGPSYLINSGGGYRITRTQQIDFHIAMGLNDNAPSYIFGVGYSFRFDGLF